MKRVLLLSMLQMLIANMLFAYQRDSLSVNLSIAKLFDLAKNNSKQLALSMEDIAINKQSTEIAQSAALPEINAGIQLGYISNASSWNNRLKNRESVTMPHVSNNFSVEANQVVYNGHAIKNKIAKAELMEQMAGFNYDKNKEDVLFLLLGKYFDLYRLNNYDAVYTENIRLARERLKNINELRKEGMVTQNDVVRSELQLTNLSVAKEEVKSDISIANHELCIILGIDPHATLKIDTAFSLEKTSPASLQDNLQVAYNSSPLAKITAVEEGLTLKDIDLAKGERLPSVSLYAETALQRPFLYSIPPMDVYLNFAQVGVRLSYNISSLYHAKEHISLANLKHHKQQVQTAFVKEKIDLAVQQAYVKWMEARKSYVSYEKSAQLANSNYKIVEAKYYNQFNVLTDMIDASNAKLSAELEMDNARANILFRWYQLQKATGQL